MEQFRFGPDNMVALLRRNHVGQNVALKSSAVHEELQDATFWIDISHVWAKWKSKQLPCEDQDFSDSQQTVEQAGYKSENQKKVQKANIGLSLNLLIEKCVSKSL
ncbi:uncharacterized protein V6R79_004785 [Siganus canaliculatus]